jgi:glucose dehydrogenase
MDITTLFAGFALNLVIAILIVRFIYYPAKQNKNYVFTFLAFNTIIYFVMSVLSTAEIGVGVGFGLFAIFSVLRYRTNAMATREMTYLFVLIGLPVINSVMMREANWITLAALNVAIVAILYVLEREWGFTYTSAKNIRYERLDLVRPENHQALLADLRTRTGLPVTRVEIGSIDLINDSARLRIYFAEPRTQRRSSDEVIVVGDDDD